MLEEENLDKFKKFWPKDAPDINNIPKYIKKYKNLVINLIKKNFIKIEYPS